MFSKCPSRGTKKAEELFKKHYGHLISINGCVDDFDKWPEDEWHGVSKEQDLNVWKDDEGHCHANVYDVINGETITSHWKTIFTTTH